MKYTDPDWVPPETELYKPLSEKSNMDWGVLYGKTAEELKESAKAGEGDKKKYILNP